MPEETRTEFDDDNDGTIDRIDHYTFDGDGTRIDFDTDGDGNIDRTRPTPTMRPQE